MTETSSLGIEIAEEDPSTLTEYARIPIAFKTLTVLDVAPALAPATGFVVTERRLAASFDKDYDADPGNSPRDWPHRFDLASWGILSARIDGHRVGGAAVIARAPAIEMLEGRDDLALLWDLRVAPAFRGRGVGTRLLGAAEDWARRRGALFLKVETQNVNLPACRLYARHGFRLVSVKRGAYPEYPDEIELLWYKSIGRPT
jgi:GNAT superfamily N-acetyltransferase